MKAQMESTLERRRMVIQGAVQGVGFRPFVYWLAGEVGVGGWVSNSAQGVLIEAEASSAKLDDFQTQLQTQKPPHSFIQRILVEAIPIIGTASFEIRESNDAGSRSTVILPDFATCPECLQEIFDPSNRRYHYPFTNCTHCGPRYSIIERLPYDRPNTSMHVFEMCPRCRSEYENPLDRRFHAQPNACRHCGPQLSFWNAAGKVTAIRDGALLAAADAIRRGAVVAVKGMGGFQLLVDARDPAAVRRLRERKQRPAKPFAIMVPKLEMVKSICQLSSAERALLTSSEAPIVLLTRLLDDETVCAEVAPGNPNLGVMLPYTPLHHLLMADLGFPVVATSGNLSGEPICIDEHEALERLKGIADVFLVHNRPIARPVDDSVVRIMADTECVLRRARGYAPLPIEFPDELPVMVAAGAHLKNTVAVSIGRQVFISQHIGDLETPEAVNVFKAAMKDLQGLYDQPPALVACDLHPDYRSTKLAQELAQQAGTPLVRVQHHYAHVLACMTEHRLTGPVLGIAWDGTGYGTDGSIWGGEFLRVSERAFERCVSLRPFRLPGGEHAIREPRRVALGLLYELYGQNLPNLPQLGFSTAELGLLKQALAGKLNAPQTTSMGRLFDAAAALLGLRTHVSFEGQAAMDLEFSCQGVTTERSYPFIVSPLTLEEANGRSMINWNMLIEGMLADLALGCSIAEIAAVFHRTLVEMILTVAEQQQVEQVVLSGGCFQNKRLLEESVFHLRKAGFRPYWSQKVPANDGGIALGQIAAAQRELNSRTAAL